MCPPPDHKADSTGLAHRGCLTHAWKASTSPENGTQVATAPAGANQLACWCVIWFTSPPPQVGATTTPVYIKSGPPATPHLSSLLGNPGCPGFAAPPGPASSASGVMVYSVPVCSGPPEHVCSGAPLFWKRDWVRVAPLPPREASSSGWYRVPTPGPSGPPLSGSLGGGWLSPLARWGRRHCEQSQLLTAPCCGRRGLGGRQSWALAPHPVPWHCPILAPQISHQSPAPHLVR